MPLTLGIDCALRWLNLGLADGEKPLAETNLDVGRGQSELLPGEVERFLAGRKAALKDLELISVTVGPGYYTGMRVGVAYATALAEALKIKVVPVMSLYAFAYDLLNPDWTVAPVVRANNRTLYGALYRGHLEIFSGCYEPRQFVDLLRSHHMPSEKPIVTGAEALPWEAFSGLDHIRLPRIPSIGINVALAATRIPAQDPTEVHAVYMRDPD